jgi:hypothetical protein
VIAIHTDWSITASELRVAYRLTNKHPVAAYAYVLPRTAPEREPRPGSAYALLSNGDVDLTLLLGTCEPPAGLSVPVRIQPLAVRVPPGQQFASELWLPIPVPEWDAYSDPDGPGDKARPVNVYLLSLVIEYVLDGEAYFRHPAANGTWDVGGSPVRRVSVTHVPDHPLPVLGRRSESQLR